MRQNIKSKNKHLPRVDNQVNRIRALLLNINDNIEVTSLDFNISIKEFNSYFLVLQHAGYIMLKNEEKEFFSTSYVISDIDRFNKLKNNAYKLIPKVIIPVLSSILPCLL